MYTRMYDTVYIMHETTNCYTEFCSQGSTQNIKQGCKVLGGWGQKYFENLGVNILNFTMMPLTYFDYATQGDP